MGGPAKPSALLALLFLVACKAEGGAMGVNLPPTATIQSPAPGSAFMQGDPILFQGSADDPEQGALNGGSLRWSSNRDGNLGTGVSLSVSTLSAGGHTIRLRALDNQSAVGQATVSVTITPQGQPTLALQRVTGGLSRPVFLTSPAGDQRLFIVEKIGYIRIFANGSLLPTPFLDIHTKVSTGNEQGLLGLAFDPNYTQTGRFYVYYTSPVGTQNAGTMVLARYTVSGNPNLANSRSEQVLLTIDDRYDNHNGGMLAFGPNDGYLYLGLGDGGGGGDPLSTGQDRRDLLGSMLRLDVSGPGAYTIPATNPYAGHAQFRHELWNYGLRNPWRYSFDRQTGDLYIGDVGQGAEEEIDVAPAASTGGENYGWSVMEGSSCYPASANCNRSGLTLPVLDYDHSQGCAVTGGYVYRGPAIPAIQGLYFYGEYCQGWVRTFRYQNGQASNRQNWPALDPGGNITSFGEDDAGELYILTDGGTVYRIVEQ